MNEKIKIILVVNIILTVIGIFIIPSFIREVWDLAVLIAFFFGIILIELPIFSTVLKSDDWNNKIRIARKYKCQVKTFNDILFQVYL